MMTTTIGDVDHHDVDHGDDQDDAHDYDDDNDHGDDDEGDDDGDDDDFCPKTPIRCMSLQISCPLES